MTGPTTLQAFFSQLHLCWYASLGTILAQVCLLSNHVTKHISSSSVSIWDGGTGEVKCIGWGYTEQFQYRKHALRSVFFPSSSTHLPTQTPQGKKIVQQHHEQKILHTRIVLSLINKMLVSVVQNPAGPRKVPQVKEIMKGLNDYLSHWQRQIPYNRN